VGRVVFEDGLNRMLPEAARASGLNWWNMGNTKPTVGRDLKN
jgi:hypothetical protein